MIPAIVVSIPNEMEVHIGTGLAGPFPAIAPNAARTVMKTRSAPISYIMRFIMALHVVSDLRTAIIHHETYLNWDKT